MVKPECGGTALGHPIGSRRFQHIERAGDVRINEIGGAINRPVHMAFGGQMHHHIGLMGGKNPVQCGAVPNVSLFKHIAGGVRHARHIVQTGGIGQRIQIDDAVPRPHRMAHDG